MKTLIALAGLLLSSLAAVPSRDAEMATIPPGAYRPLFRADKATKEVRVATFFLGVKPVTNGEFLAFVRANPAWQRSRVKRLFADEGYLSHWAGDLELGQARPDQPVTRVSWFAAKAYAAAQDQRLPTTDEWEFAAGGGFVSADGANEPEFRRALAGWYASPSPDVLPEAGSGRPNVHGVRDLHGLVWEWTSDFNSAFVTGDSRSGGSSERQLFCGAGAAGAANVTDYAAYMRYGMRSSLKAGYTVHNLGFRCAKDLP